MTLNTTLNTVSTATPCPPPLPAARLRADLQARGFNLRRSGNELFVSPVSKLGADDRASIKANRAALLALLPDDRPALERAIVLASNEVMGDAVDLAECVEMMVGHYRNIDQWQTLQELAHIGHLMRNIVARLCDASDQAQERQ